MQNRSLDEAGELLAYLADPIREVQNALDAGVANHVWSLKEIAALLDSN
jgi:hypothetical protein